IILIVTLIRNQLEALYNNNQTSEISIKNCRSRVTLLIESYILSTGVTVVVVFVTGAVGVMVLTGTVVLAAVVVVFVTGAIGIMVLTGTVVLVAVVVVFIT
ncbi:unnamed protein product, partial [Adineta steineri]